jgi:hypothetical protein
MTEGKTKRREDDRRPDGKKDRMTGQRTMAEDGRKEGQDCRTDGKKDRITEGQIKRRIE